MAQTFYHLFVCHANSFYHKYSVVAGYGAELLSILYAMLLA